VSLVEREVGGIGQPVGLARSRTMRSGRYGMAAVVVFVSHRLTAAVIRRVPGSVRVATCFADYTVTFGRPTMSAHTIM
jgi:hypothetical protein